MSDNETEDVSFLPGESLHRKARYEPNIVQKIRLIWCNKVRLTVIGVVTAMFVLTMILVGFIVRSSCTCAQESQISKSTSNESQKNTDCIATNGQKLPYQNILLPKTVIPDSYNIFMHPNISESKFVGTVDIICSVEKETDFVVFHIKELNITELAVIDMKSGNRIPVLQQLECKANQQVYLWLGTKQPVAKNSIKIHVGFAGVFMDNHLAGFYKSMYKTKAGDTRYIATTHFEPTDARAAFPCFDEPGLKAKFQLTMVRDKTHISLFNMPLVKTVNSDKGTNLVEDVFQESVKMSTYLVAFVVCDYSSLKNTTKRGTKVGVYAPSDTIATAQFALDSAVKILDYYEGFFDVDYPLPKQDLIAIPDFAAGAMENWGLITYRMTSILYDPAISSTKNQQWVAVVVAHELAHQWFGNLVTMAWWDDLWLNEGFASFCEYIGSDIVKPEWQMQDQFVIDDLLRALYLDSLTTSHPISVPVHSPDEINDIFDTISYSKGASIIRMLKNYLGGDIFKAGLTSYLKKYTYSNAATKDLWNSFSGAVQGSSSGAQLTSDVAGLMDTWTKQMGYPVVTLKRSGNRVTVTQDRFLLYPESEIKEEFKSPYGYKWQIPFLYSVSSEPSNGKKLLISDHSVSFNIAEHTNWVKGNAGMFGYYRVNYDEQNWNKLVSQLHTNHTVFSSSERAGLIDDAFMLSRAGLLNINTSLNLSLYMVNEHDYLPWNSLLANLGYIESRIKTKPIYTHYKKYLLKKLMTNQLKATTWEDKGTTLQKYLRSSILQEAVELGDKQSVQKGQQLFQQWKSDPSSESISPNLRSLVYMTGIKYSRDVEDWEFMWDRYCKETDDSEKEKLLNALAQTQDSSLLVRLLNYAMDKTKVRTQDTSSALRAVAANPGGQVLAWRFFQQHWDLFHARYAGLSFIMASMIKSLAGGFDTQFDYDEVKKFFDTRDAGSGKRAVQQVLEKIQMNIDWLKTHEDNIAHWLKEKSYINPSP